MVDIPPLFIAKAIVTTAAQVPTAEGNAPVAAIIQALPEKFIDIQRPLTLTGFITSVQDNGNFTLKTPSGDFSLKVPAYSPDGTKNPVLDQLASCLQSQKPLNIVVEPGSPPTQALISLPNATSAGLATGMQPPVQTAPPLQNTFAPGAIFTAVMLPSAPSGEQQGHLGPQNVSLTEHTPDIAPQQQTSAPPFQAQEEAVLTTLQEIVSGISGKETKPNNPSPTPQADALLLNLKVGKEINFRVVTIALPDAPDPPLSQPDQVVATVVNKGIEGQLLIAVKDKVMFVRESIDIPVGSKILLTVLPKPEELEPALVLKPENEAVALRDLMAALSQANPQLAQQVLESNIPQLNVALPKTLLLLFNVLGQGTPQNWLGPAVAAELGAIGKQELVTKFVEEMKRENVSVKDNVVGEWKSWPLPIFSGQQFQMLHLYVHQDFGKQSKADASQSSSTKTRFLINLNLTRLGPMQLDGLSQPKQLDLVIRSERHLPQSLPGELRDLYLNTLEAIGLTGSIIFQTGRQNWLIMQKPLASLTDGFVT